MSNEMKSKLKPIIIIIIVLVVAVAGFFIAKSILSSRNIPVLDFGNEDTNTMPEDTITTDDIFGDDITDEEKDFLATNNTITANNNTNNTQTNQDSSINLTDDGLYEVNNSNIPDVPPASKPNNSGNSAYTYNTDGTVLVTTSNTLRPNNNTAASIIPETSDSNQNVRISSFIINYNDRFVATRNNPLLITLAVKAPQEARYAKIRVYARKIDNNYNILSRDLVFYLPKIYVLDGQAQTQFYFAGRLSSGSRYLPKGRYLLYAEAEITDANGKSVGKTGRYPLPKWNYVVTLQ